MGLYGYEELTSERVSSLFAHFNETNADLRAQLEDWNGQGRLKVRVVRNFKPMFGGEHFFIARKGEGSALEIYVTDSFQSSHEALAEAVALCFLKIQEGDHSRLSRGPLVFSRTLTEKMHGVSPLTSYLPRIPL